MKIRTLFLVIILLFVISVSFAGNKITIEDTYGTWVNSDYNDKGIEAVAIMTSEGKIIRYNSEKDTEPYWTGNYTVVDSWYDSEGNLWLKRTFDSDTHAREDFIGYELSKYSDSARVWEAVWKSSGYPTEMSLIAGTYEIRYRQE